MKPERNIHRKKSRLATLVKVMFLALFVEIGFLLLASLALWQDSNFGGGWRLAIFICCFAGALGIIWLARGWHSLTKEISAIAAKIAQSDSRLPDMTTHEDAVLDKLLSAIGGHMSGYQSLLDELAEQIEELKIQQRVTCRQKLNLESIIYGIRDAVIVTDVSDKLLIANETAGEMFNFNCRNCGYQSIDDIIDKNRFNLTEYIKKSRQSKSRHIKYELELKHDNELKIFDCTISCIFDDENNISGVVAILHDVTREKEVAKMKNDFVSHVSHELKTPLASINAYAEMLVDDEAENDETRKEFYSIIQSQAQRLNRLIEDILNISRIESGLIKVDKQPLSLAMIIKEQLQMIKGYADEKNIKIINPELIMYDQVYGDKDMISQVIVNLLSNAVKYTPNDGNITVAMEVDESEGFTRVSITDTGVGISENEVNRVFDKFYRVKANESQAKGTGLGLNLVKQIVEKVHNGRVFVESRIGQGSTFGFELPLAKAGVVEERV